MTIKVGLKMNSILLSFFSTFMKSIRMTFKRIFGRQLHQWIKKEEDISAQ